MNSNYILTLSFIIGFITLNESFTFKIQSMSATGLSDEDPGWFDGASDPYVKVLCFDEYVDQLTDHTWFYDDHCYETNYISGNHNPNWGSTIISSINLSWESQSNTIHTGSVQYLMFCIMDYDPTSSDDLIGCTDYIGWDQIEIIQGCETTQAYSKGLKANPWGVDCCEGTFNFEIYKEC
eukprot:132454_1